MSTSADSVVFVLAAFLSLTSSWLLVVRIERLGERLGLTEDALGLLAALAADAPEITSAVTALVNHERAVGTGVIIGSNLFNLAALLGLGALVGGRIGLHRKVVVLGGTVATWIALVCVALVTGIVSAPVAVAAVLVVVVPYVVVLGARRWPPSWLRIPTRSVAWLRLATEEEGAELSQAIRPRRGTPRDALVALVALVVVVGASYVMERVASSLGRRFSIAGILVGGLVLAAVTSLPNAVAAVYLAAKGRGAAVLSTAFNSNAINVVAGLMLPALVIGVAAPSGAALFVAWSYAALTVYAVAIAYAQRGVRRGAGASIIALYGIFVVLLVLKP